MNEPIYLDHNATTPLEARVAQAMAEAERTAGWNPGSQHAQGRAARKLLEEAREEIAALLGASLHGAAAERLVFTSGGTEANNLALLGLGRGAGEQPPPRLIVSALEHPSVAEPALSCERLGNSLAQLPATPSGLVDLAPLPDLLNRPARLVALMLASNETGVLQPVAEVAAACRAAGTLLHVDAVQAVGKVPVNFRALGCHSLSLSAHKFHGPRGIGALVVAAGVPVTPLLFGGFQEGGLRAGTESVALVAGLRAALRIWQHEGEQRAQHLAQLREAFERKLRSALPDMVVHGEAVARLPHTSCLAFPPHDRQTLLMALDQAGVACSTGSACASGSSEPSPTLVAMGLPRSLVNSTLRFSFGAGNTLPQALGAASRILFCLNKLRR